MSAIEEVKQRIDIVEVIGQYTTLKKAGRNLTALCPFHSEKNPSFVVYPEQQSWHCFGACGTGGDVFSFIMKKEAMPFGDALRLLAQKAGVNLPSRMEQAPGKEEKDELYQINDAAALYFNNLLLNSPAAEKARKYIAGRSFSPRTVADFTLGFSPDSWEALKKHLTEKGYKDDTLLKAGLLVEAENGKRHDRFRGKLMIPIREARGRVIGFGARVLDDSLPKYVNSPQTPTFDKSSTLYGIDLAAEAIRKQDTAIIMEGYMDVITAHQNGIKNAVACMGTALTETQVGILRKLSKNLVLVLDADAAGVEAMLRGGAMAVKPAAEDTAPRYESRSQSSTLNENDTRKIVGTRVINPGLLDIDIKILVLPDNKDPDDIIKNDINAWHNLIAEAVPVYDYIFERLTSELDMTSAKGKSLAVDRLLPVVAEMVNPVRQAHYLQKLAGLAKVTAPTLEAMLNRLKPPPAKRRSPGPRTAEATGPGRTPVSHPREEYFLALLLQCSELKGSQQDLTPEYFESTENREIFIAWQQAGDLESLKAGLDPAVHEHLENIIKKTLPATNVEERCADCVLELRKQYLRKLAETRFDEEGMEITAQLKEAFAQKNQGRRQ